MCVWNKEERSRNRTYDLIGRSIGRPCLLQFLHIYNFSVGLSFNSELFFWLLLCQYGFQWPCHDGDGVIVCSLSKSSEPNRLKDDAHVLFFDSFVVAWSSLLPSSSLKRLHAIVRMHGAPWQINSYANVQDNLHFWTLIERPIILAAIGFPLSSSLSSGRRTFLMVSVTFSTVVSSSTSKALSNKTASALSSSPSWAHRPNVWDWAKLSKSKKKRARQNPCPFL